MPRVPALLLAPLLLAVGCLGDDVEPTAAGGAGAADAPLPLLRGTSTYTLHGVCLPPQEPMGSDAPCLGESGGKGASFHLPRNATGLVLEAAWKPVADPYVRLHLTLHVEQTVIGEATGESPLRIELGELRAADYRVHVFPAAAGAAQHTQEVAWVVKQAAPDGP